MPGDGGGNDGVSRPESVKVCGDDGDGGSDDGDDGDGSNGGDGGASGSDDDGAGSDDGGVSDCVGGVFDDECGGDECDSSVPAGVAGCCCC